MSKLMNALKITEQKGHTKFFSQLPSIKIKDSANPYKKEADAIQPVPETRAPVSANEAAQNSGKEQNVVFVPQTDNRFPIAVFILGSFLGIVFLIMNLKILEEIKF